MDDAPPPQPGPRGPDPSRTGRLSRDDAVALLAAGDASLASGDYRDAAMRFGRVIGFDAPDVTAAALVGLGEARYRLDDDDGALASWEAAAKLGETPSSYLAWRNVAAARVRVGDLPGAIEAYRQADRRAPPEDKAEIATRLGWLTKETGDQKAARRYFAKGRGDGPLVSATAVLIAATVIVSLSAMVSNEGQSLYDALQLDKAAVANGEYWRLWTVTLLHANFIHLFFNMYALYLAGPIVERWYGSIRFLLIYLACAAAGSTLSFVFGGDVPAVGASGAIMGLFGVLLVANRVHHPIDRQGRGLLAQVGLFIVLTLGYGVITPNVDNAAHIGGLIAGAWLGLMIPPTRVPTLAALWQQPGEAGTSHVAKVPVGIVALAFGVVALVVVAGLMIGTAARA